MLVVVCQHRFAFGESFGLPVVYWLMLMMKMRMMRIVPYRLVVVSFVDRRRRSDVDRQVYLCVLRIVGM